MTDQHLTERPPVAVLGLGPMGRALAASLVSAGVPTVVWNRTPERAAPLVALGATAAPTVADAVRACSLVVTCLIDPPTVRSVLAHHDDWAGRTLVDVTTASPDAARGLAQWAAARGIDLVKGAILTPTPSIGTQAAGVLYCGSRPAFDACLPILAAFGGTPAYLGEDPGAAAAYDVALLDLFATTVSGLTHAFALASAEGIAPRSFARYAAGIAPMIGEMAGRFADQLTDGRFPGERSTVTSAASGIAHVIEAADLHGIDTGALRAAQAVIDRVIANGHGGDGLARLAQALTPA
ncbi:NAD(P)-dependent oxidoreductase [Micromonospora haikouensis]|uniref:NAD(P)-dependent oxidoreductase n=1 Tax=Micromonospora haikouensis TaxID=686309 RepID=UPI0033FB0B46